MRDGYSNFAFYQALVPQDLDGTETNGVSIDRQGYDTVTFVVNVGAVTSAGTMAATNHQIILEHFNSTASAWSEVYPSQMIHSVIGEAGAYSGLDSGIWQSIGSYTDASNVYVVGYKGPHRIVRLQFSASGTPSVMSAGAIAILGLPDNWPVNTPVGE